ncbi:MAG: DUF4058 family protein [Anaerolineaceae bacterium]|nr:DUF4058 family protein [Anaerolineaceae bacterium]
MSPIRTIKNQYRGINAHLHSYWQAEHKWNRFHNVHVSDLLKLLRIELLPMGYTASIEDSLQIRRIGDDIKYPKGDIVVSDLEFRRRSHIPLNPRTTSLVIEDLLVNELDVEHPYSAVVIRENVSNLSEPIAWIELLSPTNKGDTKDARTYYAKRWALLETGIVFVELDYLHETSPTFDNLPDYTRGDLNAQPYNIMILDSRLDLRQGPVDLEEFGVDISPRPMTIPLNGNDEIVFDFGAAYQKTFEDTRYGFEPELDYANLPVNFDRYSRTDQERIVARMIAILKADQACLDLEANAPFPVETLSLEDGLAQLQQLTGS